MCSFTITDPFEVKFLCEYRVNAARYFVESRASKACSIRGIHTRQNREENCVQYCMFKSHSA